MMDKLIIIFILFFGLASDIFSQNATKPLIRCDYLLYLPKDYLSHTDSFPLIIYLHGGSQRGKDLNKLKSYGLPYLIDRGFDYDFIIVSPQCPENTYWSRINWFDSLFLDLNSRYRINKNKIYITGISMGGFGTWQVAMDYPDIFAAIVPLCGGCNDSTDICRIDKLPIWTFHGTADTEININETERLVDRLNHCNGIVKFTRLENEGHAIQYLYENNSDIYNWMLKQTK